MPNFKTRMYHRDKWKYVKLGDVTFVSSHDHWDILSYMMRHFSDNERDELQKLIDNNDVSLDFGFVMSDDRLLSTSDPEIGSGKRDYRVA